MATNRYHVRSISLPSRSHPSTLKIEEELGKLKTLDILSSASTSSAASICIGLSKLDQLYEFVDALLNLGSSQQQVVSHSHSHSHYQNEKCIEELLDGSVRILDICGVTRDILLQSKQHVQTLQSAFRRRKEGDSTISTYLSFRKNMKRDFQKLSATLKHMENKHYSDHDTHHLSAVIKVLRQVSLVTISIFQSLSLFLSSTTSKSKKSKWLLVSKLMHNKGAMSYEQKQQHLNDLEIVDDALCGRLNVEKIQIASKRLEGLETSIEDLEKSLDSLFRRLMKARTSLLNIISQ